jgi:hypothetical protein
MKNKFYTLAPKVYGSSVWELLHFILVASRILRWLLDFKKICAPFHEMDVLIVRKGKYGPDVGISTEEQASVNVIGPSVLPSVCAYVVALVYSCRTTVTTEVRLQSALTLPNLILICICLRRRLFRVT